MPPTRYSAFDPRTENPNSVLQPFSFAAQDALALDAKVKQAQLETARGQAAAARAGMDLPGVQRQPGGSVTYNVPMLLQRERLGLLPNETAAGARLNNANAAGRELLTTLDQQFGAREREADLASTAAQTGLTQETQRWYGPQARANIGATNAGAAHTRMQTETGQDRRALLSDFLSRGGGLEEWMLSMGLGAPAAGMPAPRRRIRSGAQVYDVVP